MHIMSRRNKFSSVQFSHSVMSNSLQPHGLHAACQASLSITDPQRLPKLMSIESVIPSNHLILCHPLLLPPLIFPSIRAFSDESALPIKWPKYWSFSLTISPSNEHSGLISFRIDWLDFLATQGTIKSLLQHHSSKASVLRSAFIVQLSHPYMTTGKTRALNQLYIYIYPLSPGFPFHLGHHIALSRVLCYTVGSHQLGFPGGSSSKELACQCGRPKRGGFNPGSGKSPGEGHGNPPQYSCLENPMDRGAWWATVHRVAKSDTTEVTQHARTLVICFIHSSVYLWRRKWQPAPVFLPGESQGQGSLVGCHLWGRTESDTTEATQQQQQCIHVNPNFPIHSTLTSFFDIHMFVLYVKILNI